MSVAPRSKFIFKSPLGPQDRLNISSDEDSEVVFDIPRELHQIEQGAQVINAYQEDIATFELPTASWLLVTPRFSISMP